MRLRISAVRGTRWGNKIIMLAIAAVVAIASLGAVRLAHADVSYSGPQNCDSNAVVYCGATSGSQLVAKYNGGDGHNTAASIQAIYSCLGIGSAAIQAIPTTAVLGTVTSGGDVFVGNTKVATSAYTAGRQYISGSATKSCNGTTFYTRPPSVSFQSSSLAAFVVMSGGKFQFAILASCGNPVIAAPVAPPPPPQQPPQQPTPPPQQPPQQPTPPPSTPNYTIQKMVATHGSNSYGAEIQTKPNTDVDFKVVITSTGNAAVTNLTVNDTLPSDMTYVNSPKDTLMRDGQAETSAQATAFFGSGLNIGTLNAGASTTFTFEALAGANETDSNCKAELLPNTAHMTATGLPPASATATVSIVCTPITVTVIKTVPAPTPPPAQPTTLTSVGTSTGSAAGLFTFTAIGGTIGYRWFVSRRLSR